MPLEKRAQTDSLSERVFPGSALPTLREIIQAADGVLQVKSVLEHGNHYQRTLKQWHENLFRQRKQAMALHGDETFRHFKRYLQNAEMGFLMGNLALYRVVLENPKEFFGRS